MDEVVLGMPVGGRTVGIVRSAAGVLIFGGRVDSGGGAVLTGFEPLARVVEGRTVVAGRLPPGAAAVAVIDDRGDEFEATVGGGVWVAVCGEAAFSEPLVRFSDPAGSIVAPPFPDGARRPVPDARESCPVCTAVAWILVDGAEEGFEVRCERCGVPVFQGTVCVEDEYADDELDEDEDLEDDVDGSWRPAEAPASVTFPIYAVAGRAASVGGRRGGRDAPVTAVDIRHAVEPALLRVSSRDGTEDAGVLRAGLRDRLADLIESDIWDDALSDAALEVRTADAVRAARRRAARAVFEHRAFVIDGVAEPFGFVAAGGAWTAARDHYGLQVTIEARDVDPATVVLERFADPSELQAGTTGAAAPETTARRRVTDGKLLRRDEVAALIGQCGLDAHREAILGAVLAGYRLEPGGAGRSRIGGLPDMAEGEVWPHGADGIPYTFVAQIDCSALPPLEGDFVGSEWRHSGALLRIFAALDARIPEPGPALGLAVAPDVPVARAALPPRPDPMPPSAWEADDESLRMLRETPVRAVPFLTAAVGWYVLPEGARELEDHAYRDFAERLSGGRAPQLLGHAESVQAEDPRYAGGWLRKEADLQSRDAWRVLLNVADGYEGMSFGDGGALAVVVPAADLAGGRYDRLVTEPSMH